MLMINKDSIGVRPGNNKSPDKSVSRHFPRPGKNTLNGHQKRFSFAYFSNIIMVGEPQIGLNDNLKFHGVDPSSKPAQKHPPQRMPRKSFGASLCLSPVLPMENLLPRKKHRRVEEDGGESFPFAPKRKQRCVEKGNYFID